MHIRVSNCGTWRYVRQRHGNLFPRSTRPKRLVWVLHRDDEYVGTFASKHEVETYINNECTEVAELLSRSRPHGCD